MLIPYHSGESTRRKTRVHQPSWPAHRHWIALYRCTLIVYYVMNKLNRFTATNFVQRRHGVMVWGRRQSAAGWLAGSPSVRAPRGSCPALHTIKYGGLGHVTFYIQSSVWTGGGHVILTERGFWNKQPYNGPKVIDFPWCNTICSGENEILCGIFRVVSRSLHFVLYLGNFDYFFDSVSLT